MYFIKKNKDHWTVRDNLTGTSRNLENEEIGKIARRYPSMADQKVRGLIAGKLKVIDPYLPLSTPPGDHHPQMSQKMGTDKGIGVVAHFIE